MYQLDQLFNPAQIAAQSFLSQVKISPKTAIVLGSGIEVLTHLDFQQSAEYADIAAFPQTTVKGHQGIITVGNLDTIPLAIFRGRFHRYESQLWQDVVFPITFMKAIGIQNVILTNSAGGLNRFFHPGTLMLIRDHIYWQFPTPEEQAYIYLQVGNRHQHYYSEKLNHAMLQASVATQIRIEQGIYACLTGPTYETAGETALLTGIGASAMGMSTIPEAIWAGCLGLEVMAISCITNVATSPKALSETSHEEVVRVAKASSNHLDTLLHSMLPKIGAENEES